MAQCDRRKGSRVSQQDGIKKYLRALPGAFGSIAEIALLIVGSEFLAEKLVADHARHIDKIARVLLRPARLLGLCRDAPAPAEFHGASGKLAHLGERNGAVAPFDQRAIDAPRTELHRQGETHGTAATNQYGYFRSHSM